jgi:hypothetical protein
MEDQKQPVWRLLFLTLLAVVLVVLAYREYQRGFIGSSSKIRSGVVQCESILRGCEHYRKQPEANGNYPAKLSDLWNGRAYLEGGKSAIMDPWDREYRYAVVETEVGPVAYVWFEWERDGRLRVIGARLSADGKAQRFGFPYE